MKALSVSAATLLLGLVVGLGLGCGDDVSMDTGPLSDGGPGRDSAAQDSAALDAEVDAQQMDAGSMDAGSMDSGIAMDSGGSEPDAGGELLPLSECRLSMIEKELTTPTVAEPGYLSPIIDPTFATEVVRVTGDPDDPISSLGIEWDELSRHGYSKRQPWNADESLLYIASRVGLILDGQTYAPIARLNAPVSMNESRWHPTRPHVRVYIADSSVGEWNVMDETAEVLGNFPGYDDLHMGPWEGNLSNDGNRVAVLGTAPSGRQVAFGYDLSTETKGPDIDLEGVAVDWVSISPLGGYVVVNGWNDNTQIYTWEGEEVGSRWMEYGRPSHYDLTVDAAGDEVAVGVSKSAPDGGRVIKRRLTDGMVTVLTPGGFASHASTRNLERPGFVYVTYSYRGDDWLPYRNEIVAVPLDGSMRVERLGHLHSQTLDYRGESHGAPSPSGRRVIFASDWDGSLRPVRGYVIDTAPLCSR
jgi:hypothetical protein